MKIKPRQNLARSRAVQNPVEKYRQKPAGFTP